MTIGAVGGIISLYEIFRRKTMDDFNYYEYGNEQKPEGKFRNLKIFLLCLYFAYPIAYFGVIAYTRIFPLGALIPVTLWILIYFTWRYVKPDYRYVIESANMKFFICYGKKTKNLMFEFKISKAEAIAPKKELEEAIKAFKPQITFNALPSVSAADQYAMLFTDEKGKRCVFYFVATSQALKLIHFYNSKTVVTATEK